MTLGKTKVVGWGKSTLCQLFRFTLLSSHLKTLNEIQQDLLLNHS